MHDGLRANLEAWLDLLQVLFHRHHFESSSYCYEEFCLPMCENVPHFAHRSSPISDPIVLMVLLQKSSSFKNVEISFHKSTKHAYKQAKTEPKVQMFDSKLCSEQAEKQIRNRSTNICVFKQITLFFKVGRVIFLWADRAGGISAAWADITADHTPIQHMNSCREESVHYKIAFTLSVIASRPLEARCRFRLWKEAGSRDCRRPVRGPTTHIAYLVLLVNYSTPGLHENDCRPVLQKHTYVMAICLFGARALSHAELRCAAGGERWEQLFDLHSGEATTDWKVPSLTSAMTANTKISVKDRMSSPTRVQQASSGQVVTRGASLYENTADD